MNKGIDFYDAWKSMYNDFIDQNVNPDSLENLLFKTFKYVEGLENNPDTKREDYLFAIEMTKILGIESFGNIGGLRTRVYCNFINAVLMNIIYGSHRGDEADTFIVNSDYDDIISSQSPMEFHLNSLKELQLAMKDMAKTYFEIDGADDVCPFFNDCKLDIDCSECDKYWDVPE